MRWILKIILFPISLLLSILTAVLSFLLGIGTVILYLLMMFCIFGAIASFYKRGYHWYRSLNYRILLSPYGIPMVGASIIALLQGINEKIMSV